MPTIYREGPFRFYFNSREETRMHIHVDTADGTAKFWLEPLIALVTSHNLATKELGSAESIVKDHADDFRAAWQRHFGQ